jgi:RHS repeat-associated protein
VIEVMGSAASNATVTVNRQPTQRRGDFFYAVVNVTNDTGAVWQELKIVGVAKNAGPDGKDVVTEETGHKFVPQDPETFTYDLDGNLTGDGRWAYTWDGENRLIGMSNATTTLTFAYDIQSRRIRKVTGGTGSVPSVTNLYLYDGWNVATESRWNPASSATPVTHAYVWGPDLSGTLQGAGGIGGLLSVVHGGTTSVSSAFYPAFDANGNLSDYVATNGAVVAHYEYSPFGETIVATGEMKDELPFRFSTKYTDDETGLLYYGYRYYAPGLGRWLNRDPIGELGGLNLYGYTSNSPVDSWDYLGAFNNPNWPPITPGPPSPPPTGQAEAALALALAAIQATAQATLDACPKACPKDYTTCASCCNVAVNVALAANNTAGAVGMLGCSIYVVPWRVAACLVAQALQTQIANTGILTSQSACLAGCQE